MNAISTTDLTVRARGIAIKTAPWTGWAVGMALWIAALAGLAGLAWQIAAGVVWALGAAFFIGSYVGQEEVFWRPKPTRRDYLLALIWPVTVPISLMGRPPDAD